MKKWISFLIAVFFFLPALPHITASAAASGMLAVRNQDVSVIITIPERKTEKITALHFRLLVTAAGGQMDEPDFRFTGTIPSNIKDAAVSRQDNGYAIDIILAGKKDQDIFGGSEQAAIGTLSLHLSASSMTSGRVEFAPQAAEGSGRPSAGYVGSNDHAVRYVVLSDAKPVTVDLYGSSVSRPGGSTSQPGSTPGGTDQPDNTDNIDKPGNTDTPDTEENRFNQKAVPRLKLTVKNGQQRVAFQWNRAGGADGYQIYQYNKLTGKYQRLKTIFNGQTTEYARNMGYGMFCTFKLRAFQTKADGSRINGTFSRAMHVSTAPEKVTGMKLEAQSRTQKSVKITAAWKPVSRAKGYQIYRSTEKYGTYTRVRTIADGKAQSYAGISQKSGETYYYKVRAYAVGIDGKRRYGSFSSIKAVKS